jgi:hypothetical protein
VGACQPLPLVVERGYSRLLLWPGQGCDPVAIVILNEVKNLVLDISHGIGTKGNIVLFCEILRFAQNDKVWGGDGYINVILWCGS